MDAGRHSNSRQATRLDAITGRYDGWLLGACIALASIGGVLVASSSTAIGEGLDVGPFYFLNRHPGLLARGAAQAVWAMRTELTQADPYNQPPLPARVVLLSAGFGRGAGQLS